MKPSPFSDLKLTGAVEQPPIGPDQRLFAPTPVPEERAGAAATDRRTPAPPHPRASAPPRDGTRPLTNATVPAASHEQLNERAGANAQEVTPARALPRRVGRHSHDIFQDQIRWLNRLKLELSERYGTPVTGNAMVQLAMDMLREDYIRKGEQSRLIRVLIDHQPWPSNAQSDRLDRNGEGGR